MTNSLYSETPTHGPPLPSQHDGRDITLLSVWRVLLKRKTLVLVILAIALISGVVLILRAPQYTAEGSLQIRPGSANMYRTQASEILSGEGTDDQIESDVTVLQSRTLYSRVAEQLHLAANPIFAGKYHSPTASMQDPRVQALVVSRMHRMIKVERTPKTQILNIRCTSQSPLLASEIVNTLVNAYIEQLFETNFGSTQRAAKFLANQLDDLKNQVLQEQKQLVDLQGKLGIVGLDENHNLITSQLEDLARANENASIQRITAEARYRILQDERPDLLDGGPSLLSSGPSSAASSLIQTLRATRAQLATQYAATREQFGPNYPETKKIKAELEEAQLQTTREEGRIVEQARVAYEAAQHDEALTSETLSKSENSALGKRNDMVSYQILLHDYQSNRTLYEGLLQRLREAGVISGLQSGDVEVVDLATVPVTPVGPARIVLMAVAFAIGCFVAFALAMVIEAVDTSVHDVDELERYIGLPMLTVLPKFDHKTSRTVVPKTNLENREDSSYEVMRAPQSPYSEGIRILRSSVLLAKAGQHPKILLFTSALPSEGKSTVCGNTACVLAQSGSKVLLIDADMRRPSQHAKCSLPNRVGLSVVLSGQASLEQVIQNSGLLPQLDILTSGPLPPSPGDLLSSPSMLALLKEACAQYDFVLLDSPPSLTISDAAMLSEMTDLVIFVVRDGVANAKSVRRTLNLLLRAGARIPGFVFNGVNRNSSEYYEYKSQYGQEQYGFRSNDKTA